MGSSTRVSRSCRGAMAWSFKWSARMTTTASTMIPHCRIAAKRSVPSIPLPDCSAVLRLLSNKLTNRNHPMALTISGLSKTYPNGVCALKNLSLSVGINIFGLLGPNGAGKSSLMRTIATLQDPDSGSIELDGLNVLTQKNEVRKILGYLPQEFGVYPKMSATDMLQHLAVLKGVLRAGERKEMVEALLHQTNLWDVRKKALSTYSG